jgi:hypothetical protein
VQDEEGSSIEIAPRARPLTSEGRGMCGSRSSKHDRSNCIVPAKP